MKRYNDDVVDGVAHLRTVYQSLNSAVANCSAATQQDVQSVVDRLDTIDEQTILDNLAERKKHVELMMAKMKMTAVMHDFPEYGQFLGDLYLTVTGQ